MKKVRKLTTYEKNQALQFGYNPEDSKFLEKLGEMPIEYLTQTVHFCGQDFFVDERVLIPRVETEELVALVTEHIANSKKKKFTLVEVGTGSGAVGLSVMSFLEKNQLSYDFTFTDLSSSALMVAQKNCKKVFPKGVKRGSVHWLQSNLLEDFSQDSSVDFIIANLPYIPAARLSTLPASVKNFEPVMALDGGADGFSLIELLISQAKQILQAGGKLFLEVDDTHTSGFFKKYAKEWQVEHKNDHNGKNRFVVMALKGKSPD